MCDVGAVDYLWDGDETEIDKQRDDVEHEEPLEEAEVREDGGAEAAADLL